MADTGRFVHSNDSYGENILKDPVSYTTLTLSGIPIEKHAVGSPSQTAFNAVKSWTESKGHRENILDREYCLTGIGESVGDPVDEDDGDGQIIYYTQNFDF